MSVTGYALGYLVTSLLCVACLGAADTFGFEDTVAGMRFAAFPFSIDCRISHLMTNARSM